MSTTPLTSHLGNDRSIGYLMLDGADTMRAEVLRRLQASGFEDLRPTHVALAAHLSEERGVRLTELATALGLAKPTVVKTIDEMVALDYCRREPDPADGRAKLVVLTDRGRAAAGAGAQASIDIEEEWGRLIGPRRLAELRALLERLHAALAPG